MAAKASQASEKAAASDAEYKSVLQITNQKQTEYYTQSQPNLLKVKKNIYIYLGKETLLMKYNKRNINNGRKIVLNL